MQAPNTKHQITNKLQCPKFKFSEENRLGYLELEIEIYLGFGI
jgi:hypothetical protein